MFIPGPRRFSTWFAAISVPVKVYKFFTRSKLNVLARQVPFGKANALIPQSRRIPEGPSSQQTAGIPKVSRKRGETPPKADAVPAVTRLEPIPSPRTMQLKSSSVN